MKKLIQLLVLAALVTAFALPALAQTATATPTPAAAGQDDPEAKAALYKKFTDNIKRNDPAAKPDVAYEAGKEYLAKYATKDGPEDQYIKYITKWVTSYEKVARRQQLLQYLTDKKYNEAFAASKTVLTDFPDDLEVLYRLVGANFLAVDGKNEANNADAAAYAKKLIQLIQAGKSPDTSKNNNELQGNLNYAIGFFLRNSQPAEATTALVSAATLEGPSKKDPKTYLYLADIYEKGDYANQAKQYNAGCKTEEQLKSQECIDLSVKVNSTVDHMIDALARAISYSNTAPNAASYAQARTAWKEQLTAYYKFRNNNSDTGLEALIASITSRPFPKPGEPVVPPIVPQTAPATAPSSTATPTPSTTSGTTTGKAASTPAATKTASAPTTTTTPPKTTGTKTTPRRAHK